MTNKNFKYNVYCYDDNKKKVVLKDIFNECSVSFAEHFNTLLREYRKYKFSDTEFITRLHNELFYSYSGKVEWEVATSDPIHKENNKIIDIYTQIRDNGDIFYNYVLNKVKGENGKV